jgi:hypothetical protein
LFNQRLAAPDLHLQVLLGFYLILSIPTLIHYLEIYQGFALKINYSSGLVSRSTTVLLPPEDIGTASKTSCPLPGSRRKPT